MAGKPFFGICIGMQCLFEGSEETPGVAGLGVIPGMVAKFPTDAGLTVPHIGWSGVRWPAGQEGLAGTPLATARLTTASKVYFVHSYRVPATPANADWACMLTDYGAPFLAAVGRGNVLATQFHPEKSGKVGLDILRAFLAHASAVVATGTGLPARSGSWGANPPHTTLARRVVACLDVRSNDAGDLVVTKGDQYDVREKDAGRGVRNLGKPVDLAARYYAEGADEVAFLNITAFRDMPLDDHPMLAVLEAASQQVFVPLTIGGGIRSYTDPSGATFSALDVASRYFRAGADKVSIGSDAVYAAEAYLAAKAAGTLDTRAPTAIEQIAEVYGSQAVVISVDPRRVYVANPQAAPDKHVQVLPPGQKGPAGERFAWYQCTVRGGREGRDVDAVSLAQAVEALGAGELLVNCVDFDGQKAGFDLTLMRAVTAAVSIPVIASSGAGSPEHFVDVFRQTRAEAALAAGIFHRREVSISDVKRGLTAAGVPARDEGEEGGGDGGVPTGTCCGVPTWALWAAGGALLLGAGAAAAFLYVRPNSAAKAPAHASGSKP